MRVYELAKEMGYSSKEFLELLRNMGVDARSNFSVLEDPTVKTIREMLRKDGGTHPGTHPAAHSETEKETPPPPPVEEEKPPAVVREVRRISGGPGGGQTMVTTLDPAAAAAMSMARSTGPKPKPGGEVRRIIPAARLEALRAQQGTTRPEGSQGTTAPAAGTLRPIAGSPAPAQAPSAPRPAGQPALGTSGARTMPPAPAPTPGVARPMAPPARPTISSQPGVARPGMPVGAPPPRPMMQAPGAPTAPGAPGGPSRAVPVSETPRQGTPSGGVPPPPRPQAQPPARPGMASMPPRPVSASPAPPASGMPPRPVAPPARPVGSGAPPLRPVPSPGRAERPDQGFAPEGSGSGLPPAPARPQQPARPMAPPMSTPPPRPMRGSGPAVRPMVPLPPPVSRPASGPPPGRPMGGGGRRPQGGHGYRDRDRREGHLPPMRRKGPDFRPMPQPVPVELRDVELPDHISVTELAGKLEISPTEIIKTLMSQGLLVTINQTITFDKAQLIAASHGFNAVLSDEPEEAVPETEDEGTLVTRPPVVTVLGHVDHGKTSLLDAIRKTNVTAGEAGGITQSIGAYTVNHGGRHITFIDTPGHEAFTAMRVRGAQVTDIAILVVAADDGVMPQTIEAINHAKSAKVPIVVAINKIDKPGANPDRVKQQLTEYELIAEDWGGQTVMVPVSAKLQTGLEELLEMALLSADLLELKANPNQKARGTIIEGKLDKGLGPVATVLVQTGTLRVGDSVVCGVTYGKVRAVVNDRGERIRKAGPAIPVEIIGLSGVPEAGDVLQAVDDEKVARTIAEARTQRAREKGMGPTARTSLDELFKQMQEGEVQDLNLIIKADGQGSVEALKHALLRLTTPEVRVQVVHGGVGTITESDILLATASNAIIIGFNVRPDPNVKKLAEQEGVDIRNYRVIYHVTEDIKAASKGMLAPEFEEVSLGRVEVRQVFKVSKIGTVAGCYVTEGKVTRAADVRVLRDGVVVYEGKIESLRRFKDDAREVQAGYECGLTIEKYPGVQAGDIIEVFKMEEKPRE